MRYPIILVTIFLLLLFIGCSQDISSNPTVNSNLTGSDINNEDYSSKTESNLPQEIIPLTWIILFCLVFAGICLFIFFFIIKKDRLSTLDSNNIFLIQMMIIGLAVVIRLLVAYFMKGSGDEFSRTAAYSVIAINKNWTGIYNSGIFREFTPGYIYILSIIGAIQRLFSLNPDSLIFILILKLPNIICDICICLFIYKIAKKRLGNTQAIAASFLYAFNPAIIFNSSINLQPNSVWLLMTLLVIHFILEDKHWLSAIILGLALLIKIQVGFAILILLVALIRKKNLHTWMASLTACLGILIIGVLPFGINNGFTWIFRFTHELLTGTAYGSAGAFNIMSLLNGNWVPGSEKVFLFFSYDMLGLLFGIFIVLFSLWLFYKGSRYASNYYFVSLILSGFFFLFFPGMKENSLTAAILFSLICYLYTKDYRLLILFGGFSLSVFLNAAYILNKLNPFVYWVANTDVLLIIGTILNLLLLGYTAFLGIRRYILGNHGKEEPMNIGEIILSGLPKKIINLFVKYKAFVWQFFKYNLVGILNYLVDIIVFAIIASLIRWPYIPIKVISYSCGIINSFIWNKLWTFQKKQYFSGPELLKFIFINILTLGGSILLMQFFISLFGISSVVANIFALPVPVIVNYLGYKFWVFKEKKTEKSEN